MLNIKLYPTALLEYLTYTGVFRTWAFSPAKRFQPPTNWCPLVFSEDCGERLWYFVTKQHLRAANEALAGELIDSYPWRDCSELRIAVDTATVY